MLQGVTSSAYPPESLGDFVQAIFLHGDTDCAAFRHKLGLFLYCLLDRQGGAAGQKLNLASFRYASEHAFAVSALLFDHLPLSEHASVVSTPLHGHVVLLCCLNSANILHIVTTNPSHAMPST